MESEEEPESTNALWRQTNFVVGVVLSIASGVGCLFVALAAVIVGYEEWMVIFPAVFIIGVLVILKESVLYAANELLNAYRGRDDSEGETTSTVQNDD